MVLNNYPFHGDITGKKIWIHALGCRTNQYEAEAIASMLSIKGAEITDNIDDIDGAVLFSCTVTAAADRKCRQLSRRIKRHSPGSVLIACGCWAQNLDSAASEELGIDVLLGSRNKSSIPAIFDHIFKYGQKPDFIPGKDNIMNDHGWDPLFMEKPVLHTRAFLKVQDGCNHFCSYCIIPYVRGYPVSRDPEDILLEAGRVVSGGCHEVVLTGVHLGLYEKYGSISLGDLVERLSHIDGLWRIRFGSLEPFAVTDELLQTISGISSFCPHLHLPLQSGDDRILDSMRRGYSASDFLAVVQKVRHYLGEDVHISTDVIAGFPGEDDRAFENTLNVLEKAGLGKLHVFPFSPRLGTPAWEMDHTVPSEIIEKRVHRLIACGEKSLAAYAGRWLKQPVRILVEKKDGNGFEGLTPEFIRVRASGNAEVNQLVTLRPTEMASGELLAPVSADYKTS